MRNFLLASAATWVRDFHVDVLRVDAVASMLYLDYSREPGEWLPNESGGRENLEAVRFLRDLNTWLPDAAPGSYAVAEESTAWPGVTAPVGDGGLGFGRKWNMGWMHDTLEYFQREPIHRRFHHDELTFAMVYAYSERYVLPLSHDEVVHGKRSLLGRMPGDRWQQFANLRALFAFMWAHPGKKLLFMGGEFAQEHEWDHERALDWPLLDVPGHRGVQALVRDLNHRYRGEPALWAGDDDPGVFALARGHRRRPQRVRLRPPRSRRRTPRRVRRQPLTPAPPRVPRRVAGTGRVGGAPRHRLPLLRRLRRRQRWRDRGARGRRRRRGRAGSTLPPLGVLWLAPVATPADRP